MSDRYLNALSCDTNVSHVVWNMLFARVANFYSSHHPFFHCQCKDKFIDCDFDQRGQSLEATTLLFDLAFFTPFSLLRELSFCNSYSKSSPYVSCSWNHESRRLFFSQTMCELYSS